MMDVQGMAKMLKGNHLFHGIDVVDIVHLLRCFEPLQTKVKRGDFFAYHQDANTSIHLLLRGQVLLFVETKEGERSIRGLVNPPQMFGEVAAFGRDKRWPVHVQAKKDSLIVSIPAHKLVYRCTMGCKEHNQMVYNMLEILSDKARGLNRQLELVSAGSLRQKLSTLFLQWQKEEGLSSFTLKMSIQETADYLGVARPSVSRELSHMKRDGLIDAEGKVYRIVNQEEIERLAKK